MRSSTNRIFPRIIELLAISGVILASLVFPDTAEARGARFHGPGHDPALLRARGRQAKARYTRMRAHSRSPRATRRRKAGPQLRNTARSPMQRKLDRALHGRLGKRLGPRVRGVLEQVIRSGKRGPATFDGDGTLWSGDVGEGFFMWMLRKGHYPRHRHAELWRSWKGYKAGTFDGEKMYELMVTGLAGMKEKRVKRLARTYFNTVHKNRVYRPMVELVSSLERVGLVPWVVSGSPKWVVAAGARRLGIPERRVIGLAVEVDAQGRLTDRVVRPVPWKRGKAKRILSDVGQAPVLAAGNSHGDIDMLRISAETPLVINPGPKVLRHARRHRWRIHRYTARDHILQARQRAGQ